MSTPWEVIPSPVLDIRFVYGSSTELNDASAWSNTSSTATKDGNVIWRAFTDEENERLVEAWESLNHEVRQKALKERKSGKDTTKTIDRKDIGPKSKSKKQKTELDSLQEGDIGNPDSEPPPWHVAVGLDSLFTVDLLHLTCHPVFWESRHLPVLTGKWFYYTANSTSACSPVENDLADRLEEAYHQVQPWNPSYGDELSSALALGSAAEEKLRVEIAEFDKDVIFQGFDSARLFSRDLLARTNKSLTGLWHYNSKQHASGTIVLRGYDSLQRYRQTQIQTSKKASSGTSISRPASPTKDAKNSSAANSSMVRLEADRMQGESAAVKKLEELFHAQKTTTSKSPSPERLPREPEKQAGTADTLESAGPDLNLPGELVEIVLVIHGIGQKLADKYPSFSFVHAVNQLRANANKHYKETAFRSLVQGRRIQFLPVVWRAHIDIEESRINSSDDTAEEHLDNSFTMADIEPDGIHNIREIISSVLIDIPMYLSTQRVKMENAVINEANRIHRLFRRRNPDFKGSTSILAHSLGSLLTVDILSRQPTYLPKELDINKLNYFCFDVKRALFVGSPLAFFFFMNGSQLIARQGRALSKEAPADIALNRSRFGCLAVDEVYNIYHNNDPVAYKLSAAVDQQAKEFPVVSVPIHTAKILAKHENELNSTPRTGTTSRYFDSIRKPALLFGKAAGEEHEARKEPESSDNKKEDTIAKAPSAASKRAKARLEALNPEGEL